MSDILAVVVDNELVVTYDRDVPLPEHQQAYLASMDRRMDAGIEHLGETIERPDARQRATFVARQLMGAILDQDDGLIAASAAYLANRYPELKQLRAQLEGDSYTLELVFDRPYSQEQSIQYVAPPRKPD
jgi:hypothetical protein